MYSGISKRRTLKWHLLSLKLIGQDRTFAKCKGRFCSHVTLDDIYLSPWEVPTQVNCSPTSAHYNHIIIITSWISRLQSSSCSCPLWRREPSTAALDLSRSLMMIVMRERMVDVPGHYIHLPDQGQQLKWTCRKLFCLYYLDHICFLLTS